MMRMMHYNEAKKIRLFLYIDCDQCLNICLAIRKRFFWDGLAWLGIASHEILGVFQKWFISVEYANFVDGTKDFISIGSERE